MKIVSQEDKIMVMIC